MVTLLLQGYCQEEKELIEACLVGFCSPLLLLGSSKRDQTVIDAIENRQEQFESDSAKLVMFIEYDQEALKQVMSAFPKSLTRPLFAVLTSENRSWRFDVLYTHLQEERAQMLQRLSQLKQ